MAIQQVPKVFAKAVLKRYAGLYMQQPRHVQQAYLVGLRRWAWVQPVWDEVYQELFPPETIAPDEATIATLKTVALPLAAGVQTFDSAYARYRCIEGDPLRCLAQPAIIDGVKAKHCQECGFLTLLPVKAELQGQRGTYRIEQWLGRRGMSRTYTAVQTSTNEPVLVKEYLLPALYFNAEQVWQSKQLFKNLAGLSLADGRSQDVRLLAPLEAIVDDSAERCYLVLDERSLSPTLNQHLAAGRLSETQVRRVLQQVLQTLEFLYGQKFRLSAGQLRTGLVHGNLSLDSILIGQPDLALMQLPEAPIVNPIVNQESDANFFLYLGDLAFWERLFDPPLAKTTIPSVSKDLTALGYIAFYLLAGNVMTDAGQPLDPLQEGHWQCSDRALKQFILRLMGLVDVPFESAEIARRALLQLPLVKIVATPEPDVVVETAPTRRLPRWTVLLLSVVGCGLLVWLIWLLLKPQLSTATRSAPPVNALKDVSGIPPGTFTYTAARDGIWSYVWQTPDLIQKGQTLEQRLTAAQPKLQLQFQPTTSLEAAIAQVQDGTAAFAIVPLLQPLPEGLAAEPIAYDGLAVFVAFSYAQREAGLPTHLNGQLSLEQLRQLYAGQVTNWQTLSRSTLAVKLYEPMNSEAVAVFQQRVMRTADRSDGVDPFSDPFSSVLPLPEFDIMRSVIRDFEANQLGSLGFSSLSKIVGQCSVYPLALQAKNKQPIQALGFNQGRFNQGQPITPATNLCNEKGSYRLRPELLRTGQYPLSYPLVIVYAKDNDRPAIGQKFAELLKTREGQNLLGQTGLVPLDDK